jgi:hypothetical protein
MNSGNSKSERDFDKLEPHNNKRRWMYLALGVAIATLLGYFLIGIGKAPREIRADVAIGTAFAAIVISVGAGMIWLLVRFLESDEAENKKKTR